MKKKNNFFPPKFKTLPKKKKPFIIIEDAREMCNGSITNLQCNAVNDEILPVDDYRSS